MRGRAYAQGFQLLSERGVCWNAGLNPIPSLMHGRMKGYNGTGIWNSINVGLSSPFDRFSIGTLDPRTLKICTPSAATICPAVSVVECVAVGVEKCLHDASGNVGNGNTGAQNIGNNNTGSNNQGLYREEIAQPMFIPIAPETSSGLLLSPAMQAMAIEGIPTSAPGIKVTAWSATNWTPSKEVRASCLPFGQQKH